METVLFLAHAEADGKLAKLSREALSCAIALAHSHNATLVAGLYGDTARAAAGAIANCGATRFLVVEGEPFAQARYSTDAAAFEALARAAGASLVIAGETSRNARVMAGVAQRLGGCLDTHVTAASAGDEGTLQVTRWFYRQRIEGTLTRTARPWFLLVDPGSYQPWEGATGTATTEAVAVDIAAAQQRTTFQGFVTPPSEQQTIRPEAKLLFVAGAGWTKKQKDGQAHVAQAEAVILDFLHKANASLGSSKSLVDLSGENQAALGFLSHMNQVGQTGSSPRHPKGLATCCHGEEPHTVGWRFIGERRAINLDPGCGWARGKADVLYVADAFEVMAKVNALLESTK